MQHEQKRIVIFNFYNFIKILNTEMLMQQLLEIGKRKLLKGTILISSEGLNGSIAGSNEDDLYFVMNYIAELVRVKLSAMHIKQNFCQSNPFKRFKVKLKNEIISFRKQKNIDVNHLKGTYIDPKEWDDFIEQKDVVLLDTRNDYEVQLGTFCGAINPKTKNFTELANWISENLHLFKGKKVAMFCTGGIRCEKSTSYLKILGHNTVYHLKGGIIQYLQETENSRGSWIGKCFVFDNRVALNNDLSPVSKDYILHLKNNGMLHKNICSI